MKKLFRVMAVILIVCMAAAVFGCKKKEEPKAEPKPEKKEEPKKQEQVVDEYAETVKDFLDALKSEDTEALKELHEGNLAIEDLVTEFTDSDIADTVDISDEMTESLKEKLLDFDYTVGKSEESDSEVTVPVKITTYDLGKSIESWWNDDSVFGSEDLSEDEYAEKASKLLIEKIKGAEKNYTADVKIILKKDQGQVIVADLDDDDTFTKAISGGLFAAIDDIQKDMGEIEA